MNNGIILVSIIDPSGQTIAFKKEINSFMFNDYLSPIHINEYPQIKDDDVEIASKKHKRDRMLDLIKNEVADSFDKYLSSKDTVNGYTKEQRRCRN